jgi:hypothetical protein
MKVRWMDEYIILNYLPKTHYIMEIGLQSDDIWLPPVTVFNSVKSLKPLLKGGYDVTLKVTVKVSIDRLACIVVLSDVPESFHSWFSINWSVRA